jgi:hypothetical protein
MPTPRQRVSARAIARACGSGSTYQRKDQLASQTIRGCGCRDPRSRATRDIPTGDPDGVRMACPIHDAIQRSFPPRVLATPRRGTEEFIWTRMPGVGGARRNRTDDLLLAKQALSQLSYGPQTTEDRPRRTDRISVVCCPSSAVGNWWAWEDLNFRPHAYQARALTS